MTDHAALRAALAEALRELGIVRIVAEEAADAILAHPAVLAALAPQEHRLVDGFNADGDERSGCVCGESPCAVLAALDRIDPAVGLRERIEALPDFRDRDDMPWPWVSRKAVLALLAATPTASPTATGERDQP